MAINNRKLSKLLGKSKSSINTSFTELGYNRDLTPIDEQLKLFDVLPQLKHMIAESKQWTIRSLSSENFPSQCCYGCMCGCTCKPEDEVLDCNCRMCGGCPCGKKFWEP